MSLNVIGLVSGGKDSLYCLAHCVQQGHKIVALANLHPEESSQPSYLGQDEPTPEKVESADLNSFMYQTVGYSLVPLYAEALGLPLYRRAITGSAVQTSQYYSQNTAHSSQTTDEVDDMLALIQAVKSKHPSANALSAGAILSTYQRTRVESVAISAGLVPLAYLWHYPFLPAPPTRKDSLTGLLDDMAQAGCDARMIKLASGGIASEMLWRNITGEQVKNGVVKDLQPFYMGVGQEGELRAAVLGEGGEYETLALDGPGILWKSKLAVEVDGTFDSEGVSYVKFRGGEVVKKEVSSVASEEIPVPGLWDLRFQSVNQRLAAAAAATDHNTMSSTLSERKTELSLSSPLSRLSFSYSLSSSTLHLHNLTSTSLPPNNAPTQLEQILAAVRQLLSNDHIFEPFEFSQITHVTLLLKSISDFPALNTIYTSHLWPSHLPIPPARVTVSTPLPEDTHVAVSIVLDRVQGHHKAEAEDGGGRMRSGLHVQGRSYWAPANIGPYSQAVSTLLFPAPRLHDPTLCAGMNTVSAENLAISASDRTEYSNLSLVEMVHMAGQIPLVPATMALYTGSFAEQANLALQHLWRVGQERKVDLWVAGVGYLRRGVSVADVAVAARVWNLACRVDENGSLKSNVEDEHEEEEDEEEIDVWHRQHNRGFAGGSLTVGEHLHVLPNHEILRSSTIDSLVPPFVAVEVESLPRDASIEWWSTGLAKIARDLNQLRVGTISTELDEIRIRGIVVQRALRESDPSEIETNRLRCRGKTAVLFLALTSLRHLGPEMDEETIRKISRLVSQRSGRNFELADSFAARVVSGYQYMSLIVDPAWTATGTGLTTVPCYRVWTTSGEDHRQHNLSCEPPQIEEVAWATLIQIEIESDIGC